MRLGSGGFNNAASEQIYVRRYEIEIVRGTAWFLT